MEEINSNLHDANLHATLRRSHKRIVDVFALLASKRIVALVQQKVIAS